MSETTIHGYLADLDRLAKISGSGDLALRDAILRDQAETLEDIGHRLDQPGLLSAHDALTMLINGPAEEGHAYELRCVVEPILDHVATQLDDDTEERSLWFNQAFWVDDFEKIFEALGMTALASHWLDGSSPLPVPEGDWPTFTTLRREDALAALAEFGKLGSETFEALPDGLFLEKSDEDDIDEQRGIMLENLAQLRRWLEQVTASDQLSSVGLVLLFDGDS